MIWAFVSTKAENVLHWRTVTVTVKLMIPEEKQLQVTFSSIHQQRNIYHFILCSIITCSSTQHRCRQEICIVMRQHKQTWKRVNVTQNRVIQTGEGLRPAKINEELVSRGYFCCIDVVFASSSLTWTRKLLFANYAAERPPKHTQTPLTSFTTYECFYNI